MLTALTRSTSFPLRNTTSIQSAPSGSCPQASDHGNDALRALRHAPRSTEMATGTATETSVMPLASYTSRAGLPSEPLATRSIQPLRGSERSGTSVGAGGHGRTEPPATGASGSQNRGSLRASLDSMRHVAATLISATMPARAKVAEPPDGAVQTSNQASASISVAAAEATAGRRRSRRIASQAVAPRARASAPSRPAQAMGQCRALTVAGRVVARWAIHGTSTAAETATKAAAQPSRPM
jgi:hypothetical protein